MDTEKPTAPPCTHPPSHSHSNFQTTATPSTPVDDSRSNSQQPTREEKGGDKEAMENESEGQEDMNAEKTTQPQLQSQTGDDEEEKEKEEEEEDGGEEKEEKDEYTELFRVLVNVAEMKAFDKRMNNKEGGTLSGDLGKAGWYHGVRYLVKRKFLESIAGDGASDDDGGSSREGGSSGESEGHGDGRREEGEEKGEKEEDREESKGEKEEKKGKGKEGKEREYDDEENYVIVLALGEQTDSDEESWCFVEDSDKEDDSNDDKGSKDDKDVENNKDKEGNVNRSESDSTNNNSKKGNKNDDHDSDNDEWHDHHHCQSFHSIATQTTTNTNPQQQPHPPIQEQGQTPLINPPLKFFQSSPTSFTIQLAIPGAKRRNISVTYVPNSKVLTLSGVLYRIVLPVEDLSSDYCSASSSSSPPSSTLESESETDGRGRSDAGGSDQGPHPELKSDFEADLELWLAYERVSRPGVDSGSGSVLLGGHGEEGKQGGGDDGDSSTDTDSHSKEQSQTQTQTPTTTERILPTGKISGKVNFIICSPTPTPVCRLSPSSTTEEQKQHRGVNREQIKASLEDGIPTVVVPLVVEGAAENESMVGLAM